MHPPAAVRLLEISFRWERLRGAVPSDTLGPIVGSRRILVTVGCLAAGVVVGYVLGGVAPRDRLAEREAEVARLERELAEARPGEWRSPVPGIDRILRAPAEADGRERASERADEQGERDERDQAAVGPDGGVGEMRWQRRWRERGEAESADERLDGFHRIASLQHVRRAQSLAALTEQAHLSDQEQREVEDALATMNDALAEHGEELVFLAFDDQPPEARDLLGVTHDVTGILYDAQLRLEEIVGEDRMHEVEPSAIQIWNHVDLRRLEPAARAAADRLR